MVHSRSMSIITHRNRPASSFRTALAYVSRLILWQMGHHEASNVTTTGLPVRRAAARVSSRSAENRTTPAGACAAAAVDAPGGSKAHASAAKRRAILGIHILAPCRRRGF